jgi:hypothetical protein
MSGATKMERARGDLVLANGLENQVVEHTRANGERPEERALWKPPGDRPAALSCQAAREDVVEERVVALGLEGSQIRDPSRGIRHVREDVIFVRAAVFHGSPRRSNASPRLGAYGWRKVVTVTANPKGRALFALDVGRAGRLRGAGLG